MTVTKLEPGKWAHFAGMKKPPKPTNILNVVSFDPASPQRVDLEVVAQYYGVSELTHPHTYWETVARHLADKASKP